MGEPTTSRPAAESKDELAQRVADYMETAFGYAEWSKRDVALHLVELFCEDDGAMWALASTTGITEATEARAETAGAEVERLRAERDRAFVALWRCRMEAERASVNDPVWMLPNTIIAIALGGLGKHKQFAQDLSAAAARAALEPDAVGGRDA